MPSFSSLEIGPVVVSLVFPVRGLAGLCFVDLGLLAGARACRCCPGPPRWRWPGLSWLPCALLAGACGRSSLPSSSLRGVVGLCFGARCSPRWWLGRSLLPSSSLLGWVGCASLPACSSLELGPFGVALVLLAVGGRVCRCCHVVSSLVRGAGRCCPRPPCWGWLGCVSGPLFSSLEIGPVVVALVSPVRGWLGCASLPSSPRWCLGPVVGAIVLLAGGGWAVFRCPSLLVLLAGVWACLCCPRPPCWGWLGCVSVPLFSSLGVGSVGVALVFPVRGLVGPCFGALVLLAGVWACRCCPVVSSLEVGPVVGALCSPRWSLGPVVVALCSPHWGLGLSLLPSSSMLGVVGAVFRCPCSPRWRLGLSLLPSSSPCGGWLGCASCPRPPRWSLGPVGVALVLLARGGWDCRCCRVFSLLESGAGRCCARPPCWRWLGGVSVPLFSLLVFGAGRCCPRPPCWGWLGGASLPSCSSPETGPVVGALVLLAGSGWACLCVDNGPCGFADGTGLGGC